MLPSRKLHKHPTSENTCCRIVHRKMRLTYESGKINLATHKRKEGPTRDLMSERPSFWQRLFGRTGTSSLSARQQKVSDYMIARMRTTCPCSRYSEMTT